MRIGRFFSLHNGRVGQFLSPRVLVVRSPFQRSPQVGNYKEFCCFGFDHLPQAQKFVQSLAHVGLSTQVRRSKLLDRFAYEVILPNQIKLARTLADWERREPRSVSLTSVPSRSTVQPRPVEPDRDHLVAA